MPAGLEILNDDGAYVLDHNIKNLFLSDSGTETSVADTETQLGTSMVTITASGENPLPFIYSTATDGWMLWQTSKVGSTWTWTFVSDAAVGTDVDYWIFDNAPASVPGAGLEVYDAAGDLTFASWAYPVKIVDVRNGDMGQSIAWADAGSYTAGRKYAFCPSKFAGFTKIGLGTIFGKEAMRGYGAVWRGTTSGIVGTTFQHSQGTDQDPGVLDPADESLYDEYGVIVADVYGY